MSVRVILKYICRYSTIYSRYGFTTPRNVNMYRQKKKKKKEKYKRNIRGEGECERENLYFVKFQYIDNFIYTNLARRATALTVETTSR